MTMEYKCRLMHDVVVKFLNIYSFYNVLFLGKYASLHFEEGGEMFSSTRKTPQRNISPSKIVEKITLGTFEVNQILSITRSRTFQYIPVHSTVICSIVFPTRLYPYQYVHDVPSLDITFHLCHNKGLRW